MYPTIIHFIDINQYINIRPQVSFKLNLVIYLTSTRSWNDIFPTLSIHPWSFSILVCNEVPEFKVKLIYKMIVISWKIKSYGHGLMVWSNLYKWDGQVAIYILIHTHKQTHTHRVPNTCFTWLVCLLVYMYMLFWVINFDKESEIIPTMPSRSCLNKSLLIKKTEFTNSIQFNLVCIGLKVKLQ